MILFPNMILISILVCILGAESVYCHPIPVCLFLRKRTMIYWDDRESSSLRPIVRGEYEIINPALLSSGQ